MKILIVSLGTRGDIEPFLFIGELLKDKGHEVICAFPEQFRSLTLDSDLTFESLGTEFIDMVRSPEGKKVMGKSGSGFLKILAYLKFFRKRRPVTDELCRKQYELAQKWTPDRILHSGLTLYPFIWELKHQFQTILVLPVPYLIYPFKKHAYLLFKGDFGRAINRFTYQITNYTLAREIIRVAKTLDLTFPMSSVQFARALMTHKTIFTVSPSLFPPLPYSTAKILGFHERDRTRHWNPSGDLIHFIGRHNRIVLVSFGSMTTDYPERITDIILCALKKHSIPAIINTASGGLVQPDIYDTNLFYFVKGIPYEWILPKMYGIIHHGGSGHTHSGLKHGCVTLILPHIFDQFVWNQLIADRRLGPKGIPMPRISEKSLSPIIHDFFTNRKYKMNADQLSREMKNEDVVDDLYQFIVQDSLE